MAIVHVDNELKKDETIWRFLTLDKFCSILQTSSLFYTSLSKFEDSFDGFLHKSFYKRKKLKKIGVQIDHRSLKNYSYIAQQKQKKVGANCWCLCEYEPEFFWKTYSSLESGIVIRSSVLNLIQAHAKASKEVAIRKIQYVKMDINNSDHFNEYNEMHPMLLASIKREHFSHERELRCMIYLEPTYRGEYFGEYVDVDLKELIQEIRCSPKSPEWFIDIVKGLLMKYGYNEINCQRSPFKY